MNENNKIIILPDEVIMSKILLIRGQKVMIDRDLAELYEVETKVLKQAVRRNLDIFPEHFMFELTEDEFNNLRSQIVTSSWGGQRYLPFVFTEHGILQLANVIKSTRARKISIRIIEVFIKMREMLISHKELFAELEQIKKQISNHDDQFMLIFEYLKQFEEAKQQHLEQANRKKIGYRKSEE
ncbi:MAG: ORF6N domain-containing protein [Bacteroidetes bacterium]|nr:ORF6N domain-containing protein [Bacteroidota bacterium]